jgi:hypothetical protein
VSRLQIKDPIDVVDVGWDWSDVLGPGETIILAEVNEPTGIVVANPSVGGDIVTARVSGGTAGQDYALPCKITTSLGETFEESIQMCVRER